VHPNHPVSKSPRPGHHRLGHPSPSMHCLGRNHTIPGSDAARHVIVSHGGIMIPAIPSWCVTVAPAAGRAGAMGTTIIRVIYVALRRLPLASESEP
jgi:hypothetical protein